MMAVKHSHITEPDQWGYQVRVVWNGKERSKYFSHKQWGSKAKALEAAISWRDSMRAVAKKEQKRQTNILANKLSSGVRGVSRSVKYDPRREANYLSYQVHWRENGKPKNKTFSVGRVDKVTPDLEFHTFRTAVYFRKEFEFCEENNQPFAVERYDNWKKDRVYDQPIEING